MNLFGGPAADRVAAVQQHLQQADDAGVVDVDTGVADRADHDGRGQSLEQWKIHMDVEAPGLKRGETIGDDLEPFPHGVEMVEAFFQAEVTQIVGAELVAQEPGELLVLFEESVLPVGAEHMVAMFDLIDHRRQLPAQALVEPDAEDFGDAVGGQPPESDLAASLEDLVDGEVAK